jgi:hypothetical protein
VRYQQLSKGGEHPHFDDIRIAIYAYQWCIMLSAIGDTMNPVDKDVKKLANLNVDKYVRKASGACEENVKIKIVIPLLNLLGYSTQQDMDFEHHVQNKKADIALLLENKPKLLVETKDLDEQLDNHVNQGLNN